MHTHSRISYEPYLVRIDLKTANKKIIVFSRVANYLNYEKCKIPYNAFIMSNFNYCPLIWMYHGMISSNQVDRVQNRALRILNNNFTVPFEVLLARTDIRKAHTKNLQKLMLQKKIHHSCGNSLKRET